jgi:Zn-dependent peptidase ImmA (M78 family)
MTNEYNAKLDVYIQQQPLPSHIKAFITRTCDGEPLIVVNAQLSESEKRREALHELRHLLQGDLFSSASVVSIERKTLKK